MSITYLTTFLHLTKPSDSAFNRFFQNSVRGDQNTLTAASNSILHNGNLHTFLPFIYQGAAKTKSGDNLEAQLVLANNSISMNHVRDSISERHNVKVEVCKMNSNFDVDEILTVENWLIASFAYDATTIEVLLSSAIDAVGTSAPNRVFTTDIVGALPRTGNIQTI
tara:strand:- start:400 stop:897 length:498 start_codon:yes stop_codon:yes gene_type:complete